MSKTIAYLTKQSPLVLAGAAVLVIGVVYIITRQAIGAVVDVSAGALTGNNAVTQNATNVDGEPVTAYEGRGVLGTLGAATNAVLGGVPASVGETLGGWAFDIFGPKVKE